MKFDIIDILPEDVILTPLDIGNLPPKEVDAYCEKTIKNMKPIFGCKVAVLPVRGGDWSFTIIRNPLRPKPTSRKKTL